MMSVHTVYLPAKRGQDRLLEHDPYGAICAEDAEIDDIGKDGTWARMTI